MTLLSDNNKISKGESQKDMGQGPKRLVLVLFYALRYSVREGGRMSVYEKLQNLYLDWLNNFLTRERFASWYDITEEQGNRIIELGRKV